MITVPRLQGKRTILQKEKKDAYKNHKKSSDRTIRNWTWNPCAIRKGKKPIYLLPLGAGQDS
jgi:hypothetical protein